jgi:hypothetical protein
MSTLMPQTNRSELSPRMPCNIPWQWKCLAFVRTWALLTHRMVQARCGGSLQLMNMCQTDVPIQRHESMISFFLMELKDCHTRTCGCTECSDDKLPSKISLLVAALAVPFLSTSTELRYPERHLLLEMLNRTARCVSSVNQQSNSGAYARKITMQQISIRTNDYRTQQKQQTCSDRTPTHKYSLNKT